jgi:hypothetical protein
MKMTAKVTIIPVTGRPLTEGDVLCGCAARTAASTSGRRCAIVVPLYYRCVMAVRKKRSISIPPELDAEIAAAAQAAGMSYSAWLAQTARKEFTIRAGLESVSQYEAEHGPFTPDEIAEADEWATRVTQSSSTRRTA